MPRLRAIARRQHPTEIERAADRIVLILGLGFAILGTLWLLILAWPRGWAEFLAVQTYTLGLIATQACSTAYNLARRPRTKVRLRRLDHAAIFVMIAGSYTPFLAIGVGGSLGLWLAIALWTTACAGTALKLLAPIARHEALGIALYLGMGWAPILLAPQALAALPWESMALLIAGGLCFTLGVPVFVGGFVRRFHLALWHAFVLAGCVLQYAAVLSLLIAMPKA